MERSIFPSPRRLRNLWFEWSESCYERFNFHPEATQDELLHFVLGEAAPAVVLLSGEPGIGRGYLCQAVRHRANQEGHPLALWNLDLGGFEPDGRNSLGLFLEQLVEAEERQHTAARKCVTEAVKTTAKALTQTELVGEATDWAASLLSLLFQFEDPIERFAEVLSQSGSGGQKPPRDDPSTLRAFLDELTRKQKLLIHVRDSSALTSTLRRWLIREAERAPERFLLVFSCASDADMKNVAPYAQHEPERIELGPLEADELRRVLDLRFPPNTFPGELIDILIRRSEGRPGMIANAMADLMEVGAVDTGPRDTWTLPAGGLRDSRVIAAVSAGLFEELDERLAKQDPRTAKILRRFLNIAALGRTYVPLLPIFDYLRLSRGEREIVTDLLDDVLDEELGWLADAGFKHASFPGANIYAFTNPLLASVILDQLSQIDREALAVQFLRFIEERVPTQRRGVARWLLAITEHLGPRDRVVYEHQLAWWSGQEDARALRQEVQARLESGGLEPMLVWRVVRGATGWPPFRRMALVEALEEVSPGEGEEALSNGMPLNEYKGLLRIRAKLEWDLGQFAESLETTKRLLTMVEQGSLEHGQALNQSGLARQGLGLSKLANSDYLAALEIFESTAGPHDRNSLTIQANLAATYDELGEFERSREVAEQTWEMRKRTLGPEHPDSLNSQANLGGAYFSLGDLERAEELFKDVLDLSRRILGPNHPQTLTSQGNLATTYLKQLNFDRAVDLFEDTREVRRRTLGPEHPLTLESEAAVATTHLRLGRVEGSRELAEEALGALRRILGRDHRITLSSETNLAGAYLKLGEYERGRELLEEALEIRRRALGAEHPDTLSTQTDLGSADLDLGNFERARALLEESLKASRRILGPESPDTLRAQAFLGVAYLKLDELDKARGLLETSLKTSRRVLGTENPLTEFVQSRLETALESCKADQEK